MGRQDGSIGALGRAAARTVAAVALSSLCLATAQAADAPRKDNPSGLPIPRFVSLKADKVHVRLGPSTDHKIAWVYQRTGLPLEVIQESEAWRRVRDAEGAMGWVFHAMLSGRRTVVVLPWEVKGTEARPPEAAVAQAGDEAESGRAALRSKASAAADPIALVEAGVIGNVRTCDGRWCEITVGAHSGHIEQAKLWGVYDGEVVR